MNAFSKRKSLVGILAAAFFCVAGLTGPAGGTPADDFPLSKGTYWIYRGTVGHFDAQSQKTVQMPVDWRTQVTKSVRRGNLRATVVNGFPADLDWSDGSPERKDSLIVQEDEHRFYLINFDDAQNAMKEVQDPGKSLGDIVTEDDLILELPLAKGKKFGCDAEAMQREDSEYCWAVDSAHQTSLNEVKGITHDQRTAYTIRYATNPDDTSLDFVPSIGITAYQYHHHGTVADTELKLVELHLGENP
jgi:hypothetical protein